MKKNMYVLLIIFTLSSLLGITTVKADIGPKPSATITIIGSSDDYYFDLLIFKSISVSVVDELEKNERISENSEHAKFPEYLNGYQDSEGYVSYSLYSGVPHYLSFLEIDSSGNKVFKTGYFSAPEEFKIAIYTSTNYLITSNVIKRQTFHSQITFDITSLNVDNLEVHEGAVNELTNVGILNEHIPTSKILVDFLLRVLITLAIELLILFAFFYRKIKNYILVGVINIMTQGILTVFVLLFYSSNWLLMLLLGEMIIFAIEIAVYSFMLTEHSKKRAIIYALVANAITLGITFILV